MTASFSLACSFSSEQGKFFFASTIQQLDTEALSAPLMPMEEGKNEKERCSCDRGLFSVSQCGIWCVSCRTLRFATLTESLFEAEKAGGSAVGCCSLCVCCCFRWTLVLHHTLHGSERGMESSSNFITQHSLPSYSPPSTQHVRESTLSFHSGHFLCGGDVSCVDQT